LIFYGLLPVKHLVLTRSSDYYRSLTDLFSLSPQEFEEYISFLLRELGYTTRRRGAVGDADGGVDIDAWRDGRHILVQCKRYGTSWVHHGHVRDLLGAVVLESADGGYLVSTGRFTRAAVRASFKTHKIELFGQHKIKQWQKQVMVGPYLPEPAGVAVESAPIVEVQLRPPGVEAGQLGGPKVAVPSKNNDVWHFLLMFVMVFLMGLSLLCLFGVILSQNSG
jgi:hypothetical protein